MNQIIQNISHSPFQLPFNWSLSETFEEKINFCGLELYLSGIVAEHNGNKTNTHGSAADWNTESAKKRAYFELIERISILENYPDASKVLQQTSSTRKSQSNGIASHTELELAKQNAAFELLERDAVLTYWFNKRAPLVHTFPLKYSDDLSITLYEFKTAVQDISTWMTLIQKKTINPKFPAQWLGYGTGIDQKKSIEKSYLEALQVACFTHDVERVESLSESASAELHLDYNLSQNAEFTLSEWLHSPELNRHPLALNLNKIDYETFQTKIGNNYVFTAKAMHSSLRDLYFGVPEAYRLIPYSEMLHPLNSQTDYRSLPHPIS